MKISITCVQIYYLTISPTLALEKNIAGGIQKKTIVEEAAAERIAESSWQEKLTAGHGAEEDRCWGWCWLTLVKSILDLGEFMAEVGEVKRLAWGLAKGTLVL